MHSEEIKLSQFISKWHELDLMKIKYLILDIKDAVVSLMIGRYIKTNSKNVPWKLIDCKQYNTQKWLEDFCHYDMFDSSKNFFLEGVDDLSVDLLKHWDLCKDKVLDDINVLAIQRKKSGLEKILSPAAGAGIILKIQPISFWQSQVLFDFFYEVEAWQFSKHSLSVLFQNKTYSSVELLQLGRTLQNFWCFDQSTFGQKVNDIASSATIDRFQFIDLFGNKRWKDFFYELHHWVSREVNKSDVFAFFSLQRSYITKMYDLKSGLVLPQNQYEKKALAYSQNFQVKELNEWAIKISQWEINYKENEDSFLRCLKNHDLKNY